MGDGISTSRLAFLDGLRGVAALGVAFAHTLASFTPGYSRWEHDWFSLGRVGVCAFFLVSGYVIPLSLERGGLGAFAIGRLFRLFPMYWFSLAAILLASTVHPFAVSTEFRNELPGAALVNVTMLQEFVGVPHAQGLYFTLAVELVWYVLCAALFAVGLLAHTVRLTIVATVGLFAVGVGVPHLLEQRVPFATGFYIVTMFVGTAFARHAAGRTSGAVVVSLVVGAAAVGAAGAHANYELLAAAGADPLGDLRFHSAVLAWAIGYGLFIGAFVLRGRSWPPVLLWLGLVSYSVYLLHPVLAALVERYVDLPGIVRVAVTIAGTLVAAAVTYRLVERPGQELGRRVRRRSAPAPLEERSAP